MGRKQNALVVVAIDFGTTYSGYAYSFRDEYKKDHTKIYSNENWQSGDGLITAKTPTAILFDEDGNLDSFGYDAERTYSELLEGGDAKGYSYFSRFKMKLFQDESALHHPVLRRKNRISRDLILEDDTGKGMKALKVFSESIRYLKDHFLQSCKVANFKLNDGDIHWVLTVPAIWKDNAKQFMREAAKEAGLHEDLLTLAYEPEAAAIYCKEATVQRKEGTEGCSLQSFEPGHQFLVLDCGGGTIDVTTYEVQNDSDLKELSEPSGGPWGGTYVDLEYENFLRDLFGKDVWETYIKEFPEDILEIKRKFEAKKRGIKESQKTKTTIPYPASLFRTYTDIRKSDSIQEDLKKSVHGKTVTVSNEKLRYEPKIIKKFFVNSIESIISHVRDLLATTKRQRRHIGSILMVGGFSDSPILVERVKKEFSDLEIISPQDAVLAVLKGAVMFGHNPELISERICPRTYGITVNMPYDDRRHPAKLKCIIEGREICSDIFKTMARKGDPLTVGKTTYTMLCSPTRSTDTEATVEVYESENINPIYTIDKGVNRLGILTVPIPDVERGKSRRIKVQLHFGYTELQVTASEEHTNRCAEATFECLMK